MGLVAAVTAAVFFGSGYILLLQPPSQLPPRQAPTRSAPTAALAIVHPAEPGPAVAMPVPPAAAAPPRDTAAIEPAAAQAAVKPAVTPNPTTTTRPATPLSPSEIAKLLREGEASFRTGDVDSARVFYRRAAESGDAQAALRMGVTFDPAMLARGRLRNHYADRTEARLWYLRAFDLGAPDAPNRLAHLAREPVR
jgi:TPR repeat protein